METPDSAEMPTDFYNRLALLESGNGDANDMRYVGWYFLYGKGSSQDIGKGVAWYERAASLNDTYAISQLAVLYELGKLVPLDCEKARAYYAALEDAPGFIASYSLACAYYWGSECIPRNEALAYQYFSRAAKDGHLVSEARLAILMRTGRYGFWNRLLGYLLPIRSLWKALRIIVLEQEDCGEFWDARRWLPARFQEMANNSRFD